MPTATETPRRQCPGSTRKKGVKDTVSFTLDSADEQPKRSFNVRPDDGAGGGSKTKTPTRSQRTTARKSRAPGSAKKENQLLRASTIKDNQDTPKRSSGIVTAKPDTPVPLAPRPMFSNGVSILRQPVAIHSVDLDNDDMEELLDDEGEDVFYTASEGKSSSPVPFFTPKVIPEVRVTSATPPMASSPPSPIAEHHDGTPGDLDFDSPVKSYAPSLELPSPSEEVKNVSLDHGQEVEANAVSASPASDAACAPTVPLDVQILVNSVNSAIKLKGREQLESDILEVEAHVRQLQSEKIVVECQLATLKDETMWQLGEQEAYLAKQKDTINTLRSDLGEALKSKARQIGAAVEAAERQVRDEMNTKITGLRANCRKLQGQRDQFLRSSQTLRRDVIKGKRDKAALLKEKQELAVKADKLEDQIDDLYEWAHSLADEALASATENETLRAEADAKELDKEALRTRVQELEEKVKEQESQIKVGKQVLEQSIKDRARDADSYDRILGATQSEMIECKAALQERELELEVEKKRRRKAEDELVRARAEIELLCSTQSAAQGSTGGKRVRVE